MKAQRRLMIASASAVAAFILPSAASADVLYDQTDHAATPSAVAGGPNFSPSNFFGPTKWDRTADDFTVPAGEKWSINEVDVTGAYNGSGATPQVNAYIYPDASGKPGPESFSQTAIPATGGPNYNVPLANVPKLGTGTYWITVQQSPATPAYWSWGTRRVQSGGAAQWLGTPPSSPPCSGAWYPRASCWPSRNLDQVFQVKGTRHPRDTAAPKTTITKRPPMVIRTQKKRVKVILGFSSSEHGSTFSCTLDGKTNPCTRPYVIKVGRGNHTFSVAATDAAGNADKSPATASFKVKRKHRH